MYPTDDIEYRISPFHPCETPHFTDNIHGSVVNGSGSTRQEYAGNGIPTDLSDREGTNIGSPSSASQKDDCRDGHLGRCKLQHMMNTYPQNTINARITRWPPGLSPKRPKIELCTWAVKRRRPSLFSLAVANTLAGFTDYLKPGIMMVSVHNLTSGPVSASLVHGKEPNDTLVPPSSVGNITVPSKCKVVLRLRGDAEASNRVCEVTALSIATRASMGWTLLHDEGDGSTGWRVYLSRSKEGTAAKRDLFILPRRDLTGFLSNIADDRPLSDLCLPATHDSLSLYGWPLSQCQSRDTPLSVQLQSGIRVFDVRLAVVDGRLIAFHGVMPEKEPFQDVLSAVHSFLTDQQTSRETIVMSIKQEDFTKTPPPEFSKLVHDEIFSGTGGRDMWFLENRIPKLGEVRGKVIMLSRFGGDGSGWEHGLEGMGIHPTTWPDSAKDGFQWTLKDTLVRTSDWYNIPSFFSIPEKISLATAVLLPPSTGYTQPTLNISFVSAGSFPLALPPVVAKGFGFPTWKVGVEGVNSRLGGFLLQHLSPSSGAIPRGWVFADFFGTPSGIAPLLVECNFREAAKLSKEAE